MPWLAISVQSASFAQQVSRGYVEADCMRSIAPRAQDLRHDTSEIRIKWHQKTNESGRNHCKLPFYCVLLLHWVLNKTICHGTALENFLCQPSECIGLTENKNYCQDSAASVLPAYFLLGWSLGSPQVHLWPWLRGGRVSPLAVGHEQRYMQNACVSLCRVDRYDRWFASEESALADLV